MTTYPLVIITPGGKIFEDSVVSLVAPGSQGLFGVMAHHTPMVAQLTKGFLQIKTEQEEFFFTVDSGVLEVGPQSRVLILADNALPAKDLSEAQQQSYMHS